MTLQKATSLGTTTFALLNGMFGGSIMVLPLLSLPLSLLQILFSLVLTVIINWYSCHLLLLHLGSQSDIGKVIQNHFPQSSLPLSLYNISAACGLLSACMVYFKLIAIQVEGLLQIEGEKWWVDVVVNGVVVVGWVVVVRFADVDTHMSGYGFVSVVAYFLFIMWAALDRPTEGNSVTDIQGDVGGFVAVMNNALTIQFIFIPILQSYHSPQRYPLILTLTFSLCLIFYLFIDLVGPCSIQTRQPLGIPQTIQSYFSPKQWQVKLIQGIYLLHLYSVFPQYVLAAKKRFFQTLKWQQHKNLTKRQLTYLIIIIIIAVTLCLLHVNIKYIITFNGAVFGFMYCYLIPGILHIKCSYFTSKDINNLQQQQQIPGQSPIQMSSGSMEQTSTSLAVDRSKVARIPGIQIATLTGPTSPTAHHQLKCYHNLPSIKGQIVDLVLFMGMMGLGVFVLGYQLQMLMP